MRFRIELERLDSGVWVAEVIGLPRRMGAVGQDRLEAFRRAQAQALRFLAGQLEREATLATSAPSLDLAFDIA